MSKIYDGIVALRDIDLSIDHGEFVAFVGPSGSGKSTLLHILGALDRPTCGEFTVDGVRLHEVTSLDCFRLRLVGFVFQSHYLISTLTAAENVEVALVPTKISRSARRRRALTLLEKVGLGERARHFPAQLSGGENQRVAVARALANDPRMIIADEPTGELDTDTGSVIVGLLATLNSEGRTVIVATHNPQVAEAAQRIVTLRDGKIAGDTKARVPMPASDT